MKNWKIWQISLFTALCLLLNLGGRLLATWQNWPLWLDSLGTALCAYVSGPVSGALVGLTGNLIYSHFNQMSLIYALTSVALGLIVGYTTRKRWFDTFYGAMKAATLSLFVAVCVSIPLNLVSSGGYTGNDWGNGIIDYLIDKSWPPVIACATGQIALEFADKVLTILLLYAVIRLIRLRTEPDDKALSTPAQAHALALAVALSLGLMLSMPLPVRAEAAQDYNDYVQTIYSSNNGLPCGEANDITQTQDGVLWIGTYAGLYRYNGRDFRRVDSFESVRNVNCLYVDAEGRLWIGTNDSGLSIAIREKVVNVIDHRTGLPSDSVHGIIQASDGYYYIGTAGSMQILAMNNGLKIANTLTELRYTESVTANERGHVAAVATNGTLYLLKNGKILSSLQLRREYERFKCCAFAPDGTLMAGSSSNHIYRYDISTGGFELTEVITCEDVASINNLNYLNDGTLFLSTDSGVSYIDTDGNYHRVNTNAFNNSIDNMLMDYQGNLWFTSSRLGLLRLASSDFKDIYGTLGMTRRVVNAVVAWQGNLCIGTDNGLDIVDAACRQQVHNALTEQLEGQRIRCMTVDRQDHLWVCTYRKGLLEFAPDGGQWVYDEEHSFGNQIRVVTELSDGTVLVAGNAGMGFIRDHAIQHTLLYADSVITSMVLTLTERADGTILAGTNGNGIAILKGHEIVGLLTQNDGLSSGVILRTVRDPKSDGVFVITSNSLCYLEPDNTVRVLSNFPYFNNYDVWAKDEDTLLVMSSAGIFVVSRDDLVADRPDMPYELLDARRGLTSSLTANSWNYFDGQGELFLPCDTGVYVINAGRNSSASRAYRMQVVNMKLDNVPLPLDMSDAITIDRGVSRVELSPEVLNYTTQDPNVGYILEGYEKQWNITPASNLNPVAYNNLPAGDYTFRLAVFDSAGENILGERVLSLKKIGEFYETPVFMFYMLFLLTAFVMWFTWLIIQRQLNQQQIRLNMADETVMAIANAVDAKDVRTSQHSQRVADYSVMIAREMGCFKWYERRKKLSNLRKAAQLHDIGKIGIRDAVLNKVGRLTNEEYAEMKSHVTRGADILQGFTLIENVVEGTRYHHERYDGHGYPDGLKGDEIPLYGRIIAVADAFDAMTSNRVYRNQMDTDYVLNEMKRGRGTQFDPEPLDAFLRLVDKGILDLNELYRRRSMEIQETDQKTQAEVARRVEEDKRIQAAQMQAKTEESADGKGEKA